MRWGKDSGFTLSFDFLDCSIVKSSLVPKKTSSSGKFEESRDVPATDKVGRREGYGVCRRNERRSTPRSCMGCRQAKVPCPTSVLYNFDEKRIKETQPLRDQLVQETKQ